MASFCLCPSPCIKAALVVVSTVLFLLAGSSFFVAGFSFDSEVLQAFDVEVKSTVFATFHAVTSVPESATSIPIGRPFNSSSVHILDEHLRPVPVGAIGEIYIGGEGVARGYVNRPTLTKSRFIPSPLDADETLYRTGDLGRWLPGGSIDFIGRVDAQVASGQRRRQ